MAFIQFLNWMWIETQISSALSFLDAHFIRWLSRMWIETELGLTRYYVSVLFHPIKKSDVDWNTFHVFAAFNDYFHSTLLLNVDWNLSSCAWISIGFAFHLAWQLDVDWNDVGIQGVDATTGFHSAVKLDVDWNIVGESGDPAFPAFIQPYSWMWIEMMLSIEHIDIKTFIQLYNWMWIKFSTIS